MFYVSRSIHNFRRFSTSSSSSLVGEHSLVNARNAPTDFVQSSAVVYEDFWTSDEEQIFLADVTKRTNHMRYLNNHWDFAIQGFKEIELLDESLLHPVSQLALKKTRSFLLSHHLDADSTFLPCHVIDLGKSGMLRPHVDSVRFSGGLVAGVSLMSPSIMRLKPAVEAYGDPPEGLVDLLLPRLSLYVLSGVSRYKYTHELLESGACFEDNEGMKRQIERDSRVSVIFRDSKQTEGY